MPNSCWHTYGKAGCINLLHYTGGMSVSAGLHAQVVHFVTRRPARTRGACVLQCVCTAESGGTVDAVLSNRPA